MPPSAFARSPMLCQEVLTSTHWQCPALAAFQTLAGASVWVLPWSFQEEPALQTLGFSPARPMSTFSPTDYETTNLCGFKPLQETSIIKNRTQGLELVPGSLPPGSQNLENVCITVCPDYRGGESVRKLVSPKVV